MLITLLVIATYMLVGRASIAILDLIGGYSNGLFNSIRITQQITIDRGIDTTLRAVALKHPVHWATAWLLLWPIYAPRTLASILKGRRNPHS